MQQHGSKPIEILRGTLPCRSSHYTTPIAQVAQVPYNILFGHKTILSPKQFLNNTPTSL
jgi:hypothetical protein